MSDQIVVSEQALGYLKETHPWVKFLAIVGFVGIALMAVLSVAFMLFRFPTVPGQQPMPAGFGVGFGILYLLMAVLYYFPSLYLYRYGKAIAAIPTAGQSALEEALKNQKSVWKFMGILMAVVVCIYGFFLLIGLIIGLVALAMHH